MDDFSVWIKWHGPYRTKTAWKNAALKMEDNDRVRLYFAIGRWKLLSLAFARPLYIGLNAKNSTNDLTSRLKKHINPVDHNEKHYKISGLLNEYWLGEIQTRWHCNDTNHNGITKDVETALIFSIAPIINNSSVKNAPDFSYKIINELSSTSFFHKIFKTQFEKIVYGLYRYDSEKDILIYGDFKTSKKKQRTIEKIEKSRKERISPKEKYKKLTAYRVFGAEPPSTTSL